MEAPISDFMKQVLNNDKAGKSFIDQMVNRPETVYETNNNKIKCMINE